MIKLEKLGVIEVVSGTIVVGDPRHLKVKIEPSEHEVVQLNLDNGKQGRGVAIRLIWDKGPHVFHVYGIRGDAGLAAVVIDLAGDGVKNLLKPPGEREAVDWLRDRLQNGPEAGATIQRAWGAEGGSIRDLLAARQLLGAEVENIDGCDAWKLPDKS